jgi:DNA adenine methylase/adenine-specific DNA-methyltransferase
MGSKYRLIPDLAKVFADLEFETALDAFSGSGVVSYLLKAMGKRVTANDFLNFAATVARATIQNSSQRLNQHDIARILSPSADGRDFIARTFKGRYFADQEHRFLDSAWSHIKSLDPAKKSLALSALCLAAARKQPRGVFTFTNSRYNDGRRHLALPLRDHFIETAAEYNEVVIDTGQRCKAVCGDVFDLDPSGYDLVYLDPPYAPPKDDNCYIKRYHFLEGLSVYWQEQEIMYNTATLKLVKRFTPFSYKRTIHKALTDLFDLFQNSTIVLSYSSNSIPSADEIRAMLRRAGRKVQLRRIEHRYSFGTHAQAKRREVDEYIFVAT